MPVQEMRDGVWGDAFRERVTARVKEEEVTVTSSFRERGKQEERRCIRQAISTH